MLVYKDTNTIFSMELVEVKDNTNEDTHAALEFEEESGSKMAALCLRMTKST